MVDAEEPRPAPPGTEDLIETLTRGWKENSLAIASTTSATGFSAALPAPGNASEATLKVEASWTSTLVLLGIAAARAQAPWTTKCSPVMMTFEGASATAFIGYTNLADA